MKIKLKRFANIFFSSRLIMPLIIVALIGGSLVLANPPQPTESTYKYVPKPKSTPTEVVYSSSWDGSVHQVTKWLKTHLKDPKSLDVTEWSPVVKTDTGFIVRVKYRAKNSFGGYVIEEKLFTLNSRGTITSVVDW